MKRIEGRDISHHNGANAVRNAIAQDGGVKFFICKATEGRTYKDPKFDSNINDAIKNNRLNGAYHYARPDNGNTPEQEALNFVTAVKPYIGKILLALDWEDKALTKSNPKWALEWCQAVKAMTGVKPVVYVQQSYVSKMTPFKGQDYGLWVARWGSTEPNCEGIWPMWALWQTTNKPMDKDIFNGTAEQFMKYCESSTVENEDFCDCECHYCGCCNNTKIEEK